MGNRKVLLLMLCLTTVCVGICRCWVEDVVEDGKARGEDAKQFAASTLQEEDAKENTHSFADWTTDTFSHLGFENDPEKQAPQNMKYEAEDAASRATETMKSAASGASDYASQKVTDTKEAISGAMAYGRDKASEAYNGADEIIKMPSDTDSMNQAKEKMQDTYVKAKQKASNMAFNAKDNMANVYDMASEKFYDAKDKANDVYEEARNKISEMSNDDINERVQKMYDVKDKVKNAMDYGKDKAYDVYDEAKERMNMGDKIGYGREKVEETFDQAKNEVSDAYMSARNSMSEEAKVKYEAAKEKASEATGNLGAKMRNSPEI